MTDPATVATATVALLSPYFVAGATEAAKTVGKEAAAGALQVLGWLRSKLTGVGVEALAEVEKAPQDADAQAVLRVQVRKLLEGEPKLTDELAALLAKASATAKVQKIVQDGNDNRAAVVDGTGNTVSVS